MKKSILAFSRRGVVFGDAVKHNIAAGFKFYGFGAEAARIAHDISRAAGHFPFNQLPELYTAF